MAIIGKEIMIKCPHCDTLVKGKIGFFHKTLICPNSACGRQIDPAKDAQKVVKCDACGCQVMFDTTKGSGQKCLNCGAPLDTKNDTMVDVECPCCHVMQSVSYTEKEHTCPVCNTTFNAEKLRKEMQTIAASSASVVTVPVDNSFIIWEHPQTVFPYATQLVVPEGYSAVIERNGRCFGQSLPGNYLLSDMLKSQEEILHQAVLDKDIQISVKIFFIKKVLNQEVMWTGRAVEVKDEQANIVGRLGFGGSIVLAVADAKAFLEFVGYRSRKNTDLFSDADASDFSGFEKEIRARCFKAALFVLMNKAAKFNFNYPVLEGDHLLFEDGVREKADDLILDLGLKSARFHLQFIHFEESDTLKEKKRKLEEEENLSEARKKALKDICRYAERQLDWKSLEPIHIHMKDNETLSADIVFGGKIQFKIIDESKFISCREIENWADENCNESQIISHLSALVSTGVGTPLTDTLQTVIDETGTDIRELTRYYKYIRTQVLDNLIAYFAEEYGLKIQTPMFTMTEKSRTQSRALELKGALASHKTEAEIEDEMAAFDRSRRVNEKEASSWEKIRNKEIDSSEEIQAATIDLKTQTEISKIKEQSSENTRRDMRTDADISIFKTRMEVDVENAKTNAGLDISKTKDDAAAELLRNQTKNKYGQQSLVSSLEHDAKIQEFNQDSTYTDKKDEREIKDLEHEKNKDHIVHDINQQKIEEQAKELRTKWEEENRLKMAQLAASIEAEMKKWEAEKKHSIDKNDTDHHIAQADAENERIIDSILRKIAESKLEVKEKEEALKRLLGNQQDEDKLKSYASWEEAKANAHYRSAHVDNLLDQEQKNFVDERLERETKRQEAVKNADFVRDMERKAKDNTYEMDRLKMQYEQDKYRDEMKQALELKEKEIEVLKLQLQTAVSFGEQDVKKTSINAWSDVSQTKAKSDAQERIEKLKAELEQARIKYQIEHEEKERQAAEQREKNQSDREFEYFSKFQEILKQMLTIQEAIKGKELGVEETAIKENAGVEKARAEYGATALNENIQKAIKDLSTQIAEMDARIKKLKKKAAKTGPYINPNAPAGGNNGGNINPQPGTKYCPRCKIALPTWNTVCPKCNQPV